MSARGLVHSGGATGAALLAAANIFLSSQTIEMATGTGPDWQVQLTGDTNARVAIGLDINDNPRLSFGPGNAVRDTFIGRRAAASFRLGAADAAAPVAQTLGVQSVVAGTSNTAGAALTIAGSQSTGTGAAGLIAIKTASAATGSASTQNALATVLTIGPSTLTGSQAISLIDLAQTLNTSGTPSLIKLNATDTASNASTLFLEFQLSTVTKTKIFKSGVIAATTLVTNAPVFGVNGVTTGIGSTSTSGDRLAIFVNNVIRDYCDGTARRISADVSWGFAASSDASATGADTGLKRTAAGILGITNGSTGGGTIEFQEQTAPAAGAADTVRLYAVDNGAGKTQLMAIFASGAAQQVAIQP